MDVGKILESRDEQVERKRQTSIRNAMIGLDNPGYENNGRTVEESENKPNNRKSSDRHFRRGENDQQIESDSENRGYEERSWLHLFCAKFHGHVEDTQSCEPQGWRRACPQPYCPSYTRFTRVLCLLILGLLSWGLLYCIMGNPAAPGGQLFGLAAIAIAAYFGGWLFSLTTLPALIGMLLTGIILQNAGLVSIDSDYKQVVSVLRKFSLTIILARAGLGLDPAALRKLKLAVLKLGLIPCCLEVIVVATTSKYLLGIPWLWGFLLGSIIAPISPAIVVPCLMGIREAGYGNGKGIPTLIIASTGIDNAAAIAFFGIIKSILFSSAALWYQILQGPIAIIGGFGFGIFWGFLAKYVPGKNDTYVIPLRVFMLLAGGLIAVLGSDAVQLGGAGPLGVVVAAFISSYFWEGEGWKANNNPVARTFAIFWLFFEPILFGLTGTLLDFSQLDSRVVGYGLVCLICGIIVRIAVTVLVETGSKLNFKEKIFVAVACVSKASVQAALASVPLDNVSSDDVEESEYGENVLMLCVLSILLTAPTGAIFITTTGSRLLTKEQSTLPPEEKHLESSVQENPVDNEEIDLEKLTIETKT